MFPKYIHWTYPRKIFDNICGSWFECYWRLHAGHMLRSQSGCTQNVIGGYIGGKMIQSPKFTQDVPTGFQVTSPPVSVPWVVHSSEGVLRSCPAYQQVVDEGLEPEIIGSPGWDRRSVFTTLVARPSAREPIWETVLAIWRLRKCQEASATCPWWNLHVSAWMVRSTCSPRAFRR